MVMVCVCGKRVTVNGVRVCVKGVVCRQGCVLVM